MPRPVAYLDLSKFHAKGFGGFLNAEHPDFGDFAGGFGDFWADPSSSIHFNI